MALRSNGLCGIKKKHHVDFCVDYDLRLNYINKLHRAALSLYCSLIWFQRGLSSTKQPLIILSLNLKWECLWDMGGGLRKSCSLNVFSHLPALCVSKQRGSNENPDNWTADLIMHSGCRETKRLSMNVLICIW